jgi:hypothetical protein
MEQLHPLGIIRPKAGLKIKENQVPADGKRTWHKQQLMN